MPGPQKKFAGKLDTIEVTTRADRRPMVIGTAGHVDHGKSSLVLALTGTDPDRLAEEKARAMTIDLGFAGFDLPSGRWASIIDVPGHEHFIKNMLAGIGGIDLAMLVVAADEGPMPQTVEHLAIIDLLGIERGVVAVTKSDLADEELIGYVIEEIGELLAGSTLAKAPVIPVSSSSRYGLDRLVRAIDEIAGSEGSARFSGAPRLPVDRVFSKSGHGTVVTGTLIGNGVFRIGDELVIMPEERAGRIRGLQSHGKSLREAGPGMRVAVNLTGVDVQGVRRGSVLTISGGVDATHRIDAHIQLLPDAPAQVKQNARVDLFTGASEVQARVTLLESDALEPGKSQFVQLRLANAIAVTAGDRLIVRQASPSRTIGGGAIIDSRPVRHRRFDPKTLDALRLRAAGNPRELALSALTSSPLPESALIAQVDAIAGEGTTRSAIDSLLASGEIERIDAESTGPGTLLFESAALRDLESRLLARL
ncbi:MAG: selenocysteine-specific translation elongation factor, partial [Thermomicrobiales bacterium]